jgi:hypothetical protein
MGTTIQIIRMCKTCGEARKFISRGGNRTHSCAVCGTPLAVTHNVTTPLAIPFAMTDEPVTATVIDMFPDGEPE